MSDKNFIPLKSWIHTPDKASGITGAYYATLPQTGQLLKYSHEITLQNLAAPNNPNFLASCGGDSICPSNHSVSTFTNNPGDYRTETWRILDSEGNAIAHTNDSTSNVRYGDTIMLQSVNSGWILETCGQSDCNNGSEQYNVSTHPLRSPRHNVQRWKIQHPLTPSLTGPIYTGDDIKLVNLYEENPGVTSYLNTCNSKSGCAAGQLYGVNTCKLGSDDAGASTSNWKIGQTTVDQCKAVCLGDTQCKSFDYNKETSQCDIGYFAAGKDGVAELSSYPGKWDYYERSYTDLVNKGGDREAGSPLYGQCEGDCDSDGDCAGYLKCFQRESSTTQVPGCSIGGAGDVGTHDYCYDSSIQFNPDYDKMTVGNNGTMPCNDYCSSGWNNEAVVGSTCVKAVNTTTEVLTGCGTTVSSGGLTCYCKNPPDLEFETKVHSYFTDPSVRQEHGNIEDWDVTNILNMSNAFIGIKLTTPINLSKWDVSNVVDMSYMFAGCNLVLTGLGSWNTQKVKTMAGMFAYTENFNNDISSWNVVNVINMEEMFKGSTSFKTHLQGWILNPGSDFTNIDMFLNSARNEHPCLTDSAITECGGGDCKGYNHGITYECANNPNSIYRKHPLAGRSLSTTGGNKDTWGTPQERRFREFYKPAIRENFMVNTGSGPPYDTNIFTIDQGMNCDRHCAVTGPDGGGSSCVSGLNATTSKVVGCSTETTNEGLSCYCKNPQSTDSASSCGIERTQPVYKGCNSIYQSFDDCSKQCTGPLKFWSIFFDASATTEYLTMASVEAYDRTGILIKPVKATLSSTYDESTGAINSIDMDMDTFCKSKTKGDEWLRIDYEADLKRLGSISVMNRQGTQAELDAIIGVKLHVTPERLTSNASAQESSLWSSDDSNFLTGQIYFTLRPTFDDVDVLWKHTVKSSMKKDAIAYNISTSPPSYQVVTYSDEITLRSLDGITENFLADCTNTYQLHSSEKDTVCTDNKLVSTFTNNPGGYIRLNANKGKWRILDSQGTDSTANLEYGDIIMLQSVDTGWILETCGASDCITASRQYNVSTHPLRSPRHNVQRWKIINQLEPYMKGPVYTGHKIKLLNLYEENPGETSYLNTCSTKTGCGNGQLYGVNTCKLSSTEAKEKTSAWSINTTLTPITIDECKKACVDNGRCKSFDYHRDNSNCNISYDADDKYVSKLDMSHDNKYDYYELDINYRGVKDTGGGCTTKIPFIPKVDGSCGMKSGTPVYVGCGNAYQVRSDIPATCTERDTVLPFIPKNSIWNKHASRETGGMCTPDIKGIDLETVKAQVANQPGCNSITYEKNEPWWRHVKDQSSGTTGSYYPTQPGAVYYTHTPNKALSSRNFKSFTGKTVDECKDACTNLEMPTDATSCSGWDCTIEGQFCPKGLPGASSYAYTCGYPETSELNDHLTAGNLHWIARGDTRPSCKSFDYTKDSQSCSLSLQAAGKDGVPALTTYTDNPYDYYEKHKDLTMTIDQCKAVCVGDAKCKSFDYNKKTAQCDINWFAAGKDGVAGLKSYPGTWDYYERYDKSEPWWTRSVDKALPDNNNGEILKNVTVDECKADCIKDYLCQSFDYNKQKSECNISHAAAGKDGAPGLGSYPGQYDYYELAPRSEWEPWVTWNHTKHSKKFHGWGSDAYSLFDKTVDECKAACVGDEQCTSFNYNRETTQCDISNKGTTETEMVTETEFDYYEKTVHDPYTTNFYQGRTSFKPSENRSRAVDSWTLNDWSGKYEGKGLSGGECNPHIEGTDLDTVKARVENQRGCNGITLQSDGKYTGRKGDTFNENTGESSWILDPSKTCTGPGVTPEPFMGEDGKMVTGCKVGPDALDDRCCSGKCTSGKCSTTAFTDFPRYGKLHDGTNMVSADVSTYAQNAPTRKKWNGAWQGHNGIVGNYPHCRIPYGESCNFGADGECCWGDSKCEKNWVGKARCVNPTPDNTASWAHDSTGVDLDGCSIQPGGRCDDGANCCKNYQAVGGQNYDCKKWNWLHGAVTGDRFCQQSEDVDVALVQKQDIRSTWPVDRAVRKRKGTSWFKDGKIPENIETNDYYGYWPAVEPNHPVRGNKTIPYEEYCTIENADCVNGPCCWGESECESDWLSGYAKCTTPDHNTRVRDPRGFNGSIYKPNTNNKRVLKCDLMPGSTCSLRGEDGLCCKNYAGLNNMLLEDEELTEYNDKGGLQGTQQCLPDDGFFSDSAICKPGVTKFLTESEIFDTKMGQYGVKPGNLMKCMNKALGTPQECNSIDLDCTEGGCADFSWCHSAGTNTYTNYTAEREREVLAEKRACFKIVGDESALGEVSMPGTPGFNVDEKIAHRTAGLTEGPDGIWY